MHPTYFLGFKIMSFVRVALKDIFYIFLFLENKQKAKLVKASNNMLIIWEVIQLYMGNGT